MPKEMLTLYTKLFVDRGNGDENLIDLLSTPDLGIGDPEKVEVTNLQDGTRRYINGLKDVGDSLEFEFNYTTDGYEKLKEIEESKEIYIYKVVLPDELCFEFEAALSTKITGAAVGEQIKMTINLTPYSAIKVGQYGENGTSQVNEYSTFRIGAIPQTFNMRSGETTGTMNLYYNEEEPIYEVYINNEPQELPTGKINDFSSDELATVYEVKEGDIIKIRGGFSLFRTEVPLEDIVIQDGLKNCEGMFSECLGLTVAPRIPKGVINCEYMFDMCENLTVAPEIPEGVINCEAMYDYTGITKAPRIPSTVINCNCMFAGCESLEEAPIIPSTVTDCGYMFEGCTSLTVIPQENIDLINNPPEGLIFENCFKDCPLVENQIPSNWGGNAAPIYPVVEYTTFTLGDSLMKSEDSGELAIVIVNTYENSIEELYINNTHVEYLPSSKLGDEQDFDPMEDMFPVSMSCVVKAKKGDQIKIKGSFSLYINAFMEYNVSISNVVLQSDLEDCSYMFTGINLTEAPVIPQNAKNCSWMFAICTSLTEAPVIPKGVTDCSYMFAMTSITEAPTIPEGVTNCLCMFTACAGLTVIPQSNVDLMYNHSEELIHMACYSDCTNITDPITYDQIPDDWKLGE